MKKTLLTLFVSILFPLVIATSVHAENILFVSNSCPHCRKVEETISSNGQDKSADIVQKEVSQDQNNYNQYLSALKACNIDTNNAGVPLLFTENTCFIGETDVLTKIEALAKLAVGANINNGNVVAESVTPTSLPVVNPGVPIEEAKRNTLIFIGIMIAFLAGLVAVGYWKQKSGGKNPEMIWATILTLTILSLNFVVLTNPIQAEAFCPVCTIAVGAGLGVSKSLGIDDVITSIWIGGLLVSMSMWMIEWLDKKHIRFLFRKPLIWIIMYALVIWPLSGSGIIGALFNTLWGVDKVLLGIIIGSIAFIVGYIISGILTKKNGGRVHFPFQKVVFPLSLLVIMSLVFFFIVY